MPSARGLGGVAAMHPEGMEHRVADQIVDAPHGPIE
jgi:hypothetical protein